MRKALDRLALLSVAASLCKDTPYLSCPLAPSPSKMERGEEVLANGSWGCLRPDSVQLWFICAVFFWVFPFLCLLMPGVEPAERVFNDVKIVHITLSSGFRAESPPDFLAARVAPIRVHFSPAVILSGGICALPSERSFAPLRMTDGGQGKPHRRSLKHLNRGTSWLKLTPMESPLP